MKSLYLLLIGVVYLNTAHAQLRSDEKMKTTLTLPEGTTVQQGKVMLVNGYRATYGVKDNKVIIIQKISNLRMAGNGITGSFSCFCWGQSTNDCEVAIIGGTQISCTADKCKDCRISVTIKPKAGLAITRTTPGEWKRLVLPKTQ